MPTGSSAEQTQFPVPCPKCCACAGMPYYAGTSVATDGIRVGLRCPECRWEWVIMLDKPSSDTSLHHPSQAK